MYETLGSLNKTKVRKSVACVRVGWWKLEAIIDGDLVSQNKVVSFSIWIRNTLHPSSPHLFHVQLLT